MTNLLKETLHAIESSDHTVDDVSFIGSRNGEYESTWIGFELLADYEYDDGFGGTRVMEDLVIIFTDGSRLERGEYDGSEWWDYVPVLIRPREVGRHIKSLFSRDYETDINYERTFGDLKE